MKHNMAAEQEDLSGIQKHSPDISASPLSDKKVAYNSEFLAANGSFFHVDSKQVLRKMDLHLIPMLSLLYLLAFLDRGNIGNARIEGLDKDLKLTGGQYNWTCTQFTTWFRQVEITAYCDSSVTVFFFTYCAFEVPSNLLLKRLRPSIWLPTIMVAWGKTSMCFDRT